MADREKVIEALECCRLTYDRKPYEKCPYSNGHECGYCDIDQLHYDAGALLKEQGDMGKELTDAMELVHKKNARIIELTDLLKEQEAVSITTDYFDGFGNRTSHCPSCNSRLVWHQNKNYCGECGQAVKWK